jgi:hypothetical protein
MEKVKDRTTTTTVRRVTRNRSGSYVTSLPREMAQELGVGNGGFVRCELYTPPADIRPIKQKCIIMTSVRLR